eukprot:CAMPEP_0115180924 /NCGR_PEP_ID=MMETSP0270-20121206/7169_1 /TAXON_ID=71861 /ORGANISM="Scrippsiella trochoidea, Strain CCMP3099" /LENGTH=76 /DNA_ID=CAMNT_0002593937 /DNA_START=254 /DNA_END=480 /DNA_ORIENTATION=-
MKEMADLEYSWMTAAFGCGLGLSQQSHHDFRPPTILPRLLHRNAAVEIQRRCASVRLLLVLCKFPHALEGDRHENG